MNEREEARTVADRWLDFRMNALVEMVSGDPDCAAVVLARQYMRALAHIDKLRVAATMLVQSHPSIEAGTFRGLIEDEWPPGR